MKLITDRTARDLAENTVKGCYSFTDLNRVEQAVEQIGALFPALGIGIRLTTRTDWTQSREDSPGNRPGKEQMERYLGNAASVRDRLCPEMPLPKSMEGLTWQGANQIEAALEQADTTARNIMRTWRYSGQLYAGEERQD